VLDLRDTTEIGGPGKTILETFRAVDQSAFDLHLAVFLTRDETADTPFVMAARQYGMPVHLLRGYNQYDPRLISRTADLVRSLRIDVLHAHEVKSDVIGLLASVLRKVRTVTTLHGWIANGAKQRALIALDRRVIRRFDKVIAVSSAIRDQLLAAGLPDRKIHVVHNAIVLERYRRTGRRGYLSSLVGADLRGPVLASIGRLSVEKGHADLLHAIAIVSRQGRQVSAVLAGDGPERQALVDQAKTLGIADRVHFPGYVDQPQQILEETDLMVLPSHTEGLPNAVLEALAMHVPVLATRVGGTPEVITDGDTGRLVPARAPEELARAIADFLVEPGPWKVMADRGRELVERRFDFAARTRAVEEIYRGLVEVVS
jgi:glycosyltransferase involved in cell wall biosynthesis